MSISTLIAAVLLSASPVNAFHCGASTQVEQGNVAEVNEAYLEHSVDIVEAAMRQDREGLHDNVAPEARFTVFTGDVGNGPRTAGPDAAIAFFGDLAPSGYRFLSASSGPFSMATCGPISASVLLTKVASDDLFQLTFQYDRGMLTEVTGSLMAVIEGSFGENDQ